MSVACTTNGGATLVVVVVGVVVVVAIDEGGDCRRIADCALFRCTRHDARRSSAPTAASVNQRARNARARRSQTAHWPTRRQFAPTNARARALVFTKKQGARAQRAPITARREKRRRRSAWRRPPSSPVSDCAQQSSSPSHSQSSVVAIKTATQRSARAPRTDL